jgi:hypothetical protein
VGSRTGLDGVAKRKIPFLPLTGIENGIIFKEL